jgi:hypothetical protein
VTESGRSQVLSALRAPLSQGAFAATLVPGGNVVMRRSVEAVTSWFGGNVVCLAEGERTEKKTLVWAWLPLAAAMAFLTVGALFLRWVPDTRL